MNKLRKRLRFLSLTGLGIFILTSFFILPTPIFAQTPTPPPPTEYTLLAPIPLDGAGGEPSKSTNASTYLRGLFQLIIGIAGGLAVVMIIYGGIIKMSSDAVSGQNKANDIISNAIWGLLLAIAAWLILYTINPNLININLKIPAQPIPVNTNVGGGGGTGGGAPPLGSCSGCGVVTVPHKLAPNGCALPGPCVIQAGLNNKLTELDKITDFLVTEMYPPTRPHANACHSNGSCIDATISSATEARIKKFIEDASSAGLDAQFETTSQKRAEDIRRSTGLTSSQVYYVPGITGEHFSIYNR